MRCYHSSSLRYWWKCEFDADVKIENHYQQDGEQKSTYQNTEQDVLVIIMLQETKNSNLFDKNCAQEQVKCHIQHEESWLRWIVNKQVNYYFSLIFPERHCNRENVIVMYSKKMKAKHMKEDVNEISRFPEMLYERGGLKNFSNFTDKHKKQSSGGISI